MNQITYFIRVACRWIKVTTSVTQWARLPHVTASLACKATGLLLLAGLSGSVPSINLPTAIKQPRPVGQVASLPSSGPSDEIEPSLTFTPAGNDAGGVTNASGLPGAFGWSFMYPPAGNAMDDDDPKIDNYIIRLADVAEGSRADPGSAKMPDGTISPDAPSTPAERTLFVEKIPAVPAPPMIVPEPNSLILLGLAIAVLTVGRQIARRKLGKLTFRGSSNPGLNSSRDTAEAQTTDVREQESVSATAQK